jgi:RNA polymerase sigma-70 factor (ECF subfamily)
MPQTRYGQFPTTHWTLISRLKSDDTVVVRRALDEICAQYHYPLYCYIRRRGLDHHDAEDVLQSFLAKLIRLDSFETADVSKGKLRSFLAVALQRFLATWRQEEFQRRSELTAESAAAARYRQEGFADTVTPEMALDRVWAVTLLQSALNELGANEEKAGRGPQFAQLRHFLSPDETAGGYDAVAQTFGQSENATRQMVKRLRDRFRKILRERVAETLGDPKAEEIDEEMRALRQAVTE